MLIYTRQLKAVTLVIKTDKHFFFHLTPFKKKDV